jgi:hypothetical protein
MTWPKYTIYCCLSFLQWNNGVTRQNLTHKNTSLSNAVYSNAQQKNTTSGKITLLVNFFRKARSCQSFSASHIDQRVISAFHRPLYKAKNDQVVAMLMKTGLNNVLLPTLFTAVNNIEQYCYTRFSINNIVQFCWQVWTTWAAKHCSILLNSGLSVFTRV